MNIVGDFLYGTLVTPLRRENGSRMRPLERLLRSLSIGGEGVGREAGDCGIQYGKPPTIYWGNGFSFHFAVVTLIDEFLPPMKANAHHATRLPQ